MNEVYKNFPIRDQETDDQRPLDLLQAWGAPARAPLRLRLGQGLGGLARWLRAEPMLGTAQVPSSSDKCPRVEMRRTVCCSGRLTTP